MSSVWNYYVSWGTLSSADFSITVAVGDSITWSLDQDGYPHSIVSTGNLFGFSSPMTTGSYTFTFSAKGTTAYACGVHSSMSGVVTVVTPLFGMGSLGVDNSISTSNVANFNGVNILYGNLVIPSTTCGNTVFYQALVTAFQNLVEVQGYVQVRFEILHSIAPFIVTVS